MYERLDSCPLCKSAKIQNHSIVTDHSISKEDFALVKCQSCELLFTSPRPDKKHIWRYYESEDYISHSNRSATVIDLIYKIVREISIRQKFNLIQSISDGNTLLDFGTGTGHFLYHMHRKGYEISAVEPNEKARKQLHDSIHNHVFENINELDSKKTFDVITAWHVIEHVHELLPTLKELKKRLNENGKLVLALPNHNSYDSKYYNKYWAGYDVPRHLYHFNRYSITKLSEILKLKVLEVHPMKFDSYYVSLLSEKYLGNRLSFLSAIKNGYRSNIDAKRTAEYSSLIYVIG